MWGWLIPAGILGGLAFAYRGKGGTKAKEASGSRTYPNGWAGEWRISKLPTGWLGQFRIYLPGFADSDSGWLNVPHGLADTSAHARLLALEQLELNDPSATENQVVDSGNVSRDGTVYYWAVVRMVDTGLYSPIVSVGSQDSWSAVSEPRLKPQEARNLALEWIANN